MAGINDNQRELDTFGNILVATTVPCVNGEILVSGYNAVTDVKVVIVGIATIEEWRDPRRLKTRDPLPGYTYIYKAIAE